MKFLKKRFRFYIDNYFPGIQLISYNNPQRAEDIHFSKILAKHEYQFWCKNINRIDSVTIFKAIPI